MLRCAAARAAGVARRRGCAIVVEARKKTRTGDTSGSMRGVKKENLPTKECSVCHRSFTWRKKWQNCWSEVTTCSKKCNAERRRRQRQHERDLDVGASIETSAASDIRDSAAAAAAAAAAADAGRASPATSAAAADSSPRSRPGQKSCSLCGKHADLLVRCQTDASRRWQMACGSCWRLASGGVPDGDSAHPLYRYGGLWKNRRAATTAA